MSDSGGSARPLRPPFHIASAPAPTGQDTQPSAQDSSAPWLTGSAYARPITTADGDYRRPERSAGRRWLRRLVFLLIAAIPLSILLTMVGVYWEARTATPAPADAIVVLGAAQYNGSPTSVFAARLDEAYRLWSEGYAPLIVLTGGKMEGDAYTEAETGVQYLLNKGVPASALAWEDEGRDTWQSIQGVDTVLSAQGAQSVIVVSDGFHLLRSELMARSLGYETSGAASSDSPIRPGSVTEFSYVIRETGGILVMVPTFLGFG